MRRCTGIRCGSMSEETMYRRRFFLSTDPNSDAYVSARVHRFGEEINGSIKIADCDRVIRLEVNGFSRQARRRTIRKLERLIGVLEDVKAVLEGAENG